MPVENKHDAETLLEFKSIVHSMVQQVALQGGEQLHSPHRFGNTFAPCVWKSRFNVDLESLVFGSRSNAHRMFAHMFANLCFESQACN